MEITRATPYFEYITASEQAHICSGTFSLTSGMNSFFSETYVVVSKTVDSILDEDYYTVTNSEETAQISKDLYIALANSFCAGKVSVEKSIGNVLFKEEFSLKLGI